MYAEITPPGPILCPVVMQNFNSLNPPHTRGTQESGFEVEGEF